MSENDKPLGQRLAEHVGGRAYRWQRGYRNDDSGMVATLAQLRRGVGEPLGRDARLAEITVGGLYASIEGLPDDRPTEAEKAAYSALTLFALHQQAHRDTSMHRRGYSFGRSARLLGQESGSRDAVRARFTALATATTWEESTHHARGLIQQFRAFGIPLDYGQFARDLYRLQFPRSADSVRLVWGRNFYREGDGEHEAEDAVDADATE